MNDIMSFDNIYSILSLVFAGGIGSIFTWRYAKKKAKSEAITAEANAERARVEAVQASIAATKEVQDSYQQLLSDLKSDREDQRRYYDEQKEYIKELKEDRVHLREERDELRTRLEKHENDIRDMKNTIARNGRMMAGMRPFLCAKPNCQDRISMMMSDVDKSVQI